MIALRTLSLGQFAAQIKVQERVKQLIPNFDNFHLFSLDKNVIKKNKNRQECLHLWFIPHPIRELTGKQHKLLLFHVMKKLYFNRAILLSFMSGVSC